MGYFPLFMELEGKKCSVIGGGAVALRKVRTLLEFGAFVEISAPMLSKDMEAFVAENSADITVNQREYVEKDMVGAFLVIAATNDEGVNRQIGVYCKNNKVLVNVVDDREASSFFFPATIQRGDVVIGISTGGNSPALSKRIREEMETQLPEYVEELAVQMAKYRTYVISSVRRVKNRQEIFQKMLDLAYEQEGKLSIQDVDRFIQELGGEE